MQFFKSIKRLFGMLAFLLAIHLEAVPLSEPVDFCLVSMPKCGTHLSTKLLEMLTERKKCAVSCLNSYLGSLTPEQFEAAIDECRAKNTFLYGHTNPLAFGPFFLNYAQTHPQSVVFCPIRDLRDMIISFIFHKREAIQAELGRAEVPFDELLTHILNPNVSFCGQLIEKHVLYTFDFLSLPNVIGVRFEDIVGPEGGGQKKLQKNCIKKIASRLNIPLSKKKLQYICDYLFGNDRKDEDAQPLPPSGTFRKGQIGSWRQHFKPKHEALFQQFWGSYQLELGYSLD